ncbi:hypothetical protein [Janthinobacterium sp. 344]|uniref:hypothetical protein n=1 Tax=Janthinobacterium sp. 344 TaxID=1566280 RepID=UPI00111446E9|nr:hypothetical protein [Janthinobacterium sp. 344]
MWFVVFVRLGGRRWSGVVRFACGVVGGAFCVVFLLFAFFCCRSVVFVSCVVAALLDPGVVVLVRVGPFLVFLVFCVVVRYVDPALELVLLGLVGLFFFVKRVVAVVPVPGGVRGALACLAVARVFAHGVVVVVGVGWVGRGLGVDVGFVRVWVFVAVVFVPLGDFLGVVGLVGGLLFRGMAFEFLVALVVVAGGVGGGDLVEGALPVDVRGVVGGGRGVELLLWRVADGLGFLSAFFGLDRGAVI